MLFCYFMLSHYYWLLFVIIDHIPDCIIEAFEIRWCWKAIKKSICFAENLKKIYLRYFFFYIVCSFFKIFLYITCIKNLSSCPISDVTPKLPFCIIPTSKAVKNRSYFCVCVLVQTAILLDDKQGTKGVEETSKASEKKLLAMNTKRRKNRKFAGLVLTELSPVLVTGVTQSTIAVQSDIATN